MGLFSKSVPTTQPPIVTTPEIPPSDVEAVVARVFAQLVPMLQSQQPAPAPPAVVVEDEDNDPDETARIGKVASRVTHDMTAPYAATFNAVMPEYARNLAIGNLTEGQKIIYERHKSEVDDGVNRACSANPALKAVPQIHQKAIALVLGEHSHEIEELIMARLTPADLPASFQMPNTTGSGATGAETATNEEKEWVSYFAPRSRNKDWDIESMRKFKSITPGYLHEMVAEYKAQQKMEVK